MTTPIAHTMKKMPSGYRQPLFAVALVALATAGCSKGEPTKEQLLSRANEALAASQYRNAEKDYRHVLRLAPDDPVALRQLGIIYHDQGQLLQAYPLLKRATELQPDNLEVQLKLGLTLLSFRDYPKARDAAQQILDKKPGDEQALVLLTSSAVTPADIEESRKFVERLRKQDQQGPGYHLATGILDLRQNNQTSAENEFKAALNLDPKSSNAHTLLAALYWSRNDLKAADQAFKTAADLAPSRSPMRLQYADFLIKTGAVAEAKVLLEGISRQFPDYLPPRVYLMKVACAQHRDEDCAARVRNILAQDSTNFEALFENGIISLAKGDAARAIRDYEYLSNTYRWNPLVRYQLALAYLLSAKNSSAGNNRSALDSAESSLNEAIRLDPRFEQAILLFAELKIRKGSAAAAIDPLLQLIKERPGTAQAQYLLASAYLAQRRIDQALTIYRQMTKLFPRDPQPSFLIGTILLAQRQRPEARRAFESSLETSPDYLPAVERLVDLDIAEQQYATAMDRVQKQIDQDPKRAQPWALKARVHLTRREFTRAEADLLKAIELDAELEPAYMMLAQLYVASNKHEQAIEKLNASIEKRRAVPTMMQLAAIHEQLKNFSAARDAYEKLLTDAANFGPALNNLAVLYSEHLGQPGTAHDLAKRAREANPNEPHFADTLGWILFKRGEYDNALRLLQESASKLAGHPEIQFHVGMAHYMLGEEEPARLALQKAADSSADFLGKDEARQRLSVLAIKVGAANAGVRAQLEDYLRVRPNDPVALTRLGQVQQLDGTVDLAVKTYEKVIAEYPLFAPATRQLALLYGQHSTDVSKAYEMASKARQAYPDDQDIAKTLGILSYRREHYSRSAELLKEVASKRKDDAELLYYLGEAHRRLKEWNQCKGALERALSLKLSPGLADQARRALSDCSETSPL